MTARWTLECHGKRNAVDSGRVLAVESYGKVNVMESIMVTKE